ncbi:MAG: hypothetical protein HRU09_09165 [Oligoflexales bacterium]|nr:hypothetical protein [Oligoflexales bacterium]
MQQSELLTEETQVMTGAQIERCDRRIRELNLYKKRLEAQKKEDARIMTQNIKHISHQIDTLTEAADKKDRIILNDAFTAEELSNLLD